MGTVASQITSLMIVYPTLYSDEDQRKHQSSTSLAFVRGIHRGPVNSLHKWPVTRKMFPFHDIIMHHGSDNTPTIPCLITDSIHHIDGLVQDCGISIANAQEILQPCTKPTKSNDYVIETQLQSQRWQCVRWLHEFLFWGQKFTKLTYKWPPHWPQCHASTFHCWLRHHISQEVKNVGKHPQLVNKRKQIYSFSQPLHSTMILHLTINI